jgi:hypothetical protein
MGQGEVFEWLVAHPGWHPKREMCASLGKPNRYFTNALRRLIRHGEVAVRIAAGNIPEYRAVGFACKVALANLVARLQIK